MKQGKSSLTLTGGDRHRRRRHRLRLLSTNSVMNIVLLLVISTFTFELLFNLGIFNLPAMRDAFVVHSLVSFERGTAKTLQPSLNECF